MNTWKAESCTYIKYGDYLHKCTHCTHCTNCVDCVGCEDCKDCIGCTGLNHARYMIYNKKCTKEEYV